MRSKPFPPEARKIPTTLHLHGDSRVDDYFWMRNRSDPETIAYLEAENAYTAAVMRPLEPLQKKIYDEILGRIQQTDLSVPAKDGEFYYYLRTEEGRQYPIWCRKRGSVDSAEEILLDANALAEGHVYFSLGGLTISDDHNLLLYSTDTDGSERFTIHVKDLTTGLNLPDTIPETSAGLTWAGDNRTFFYTTFDATRRPEKVRRHILGADVLEDAVVFHEADPQFGFEVHRTRSKRYVIVTSENASRTSEVHYLDAYMPDRPFQLIEPRQPGVEYYVDHQGDRFVIRTNADGAINFKVMSALVEYPGLENWELLVAERPDVTMDGVDPFKNFLVFHTREQGLPRLRISSLATGDEYYIDFPEPAYAVGLDANLEYDTNLLRFHYTSLITPPSIYDFDMVQRTRELKKQVPVLGGYNSADYASERIYASASDGKLVPISLAYRKDHVRDGASPLLLNAYGSYGLNSDPSFSHSALSLLDRGFVWAIAHVRGGAEYGRSWFEDGRLLKKMNTFTDFIACAEFLVAERFTSPEKLSAMGGSAGGLLMGAIANMRPDLFHTIVARVPFVDVVTTMLDPTIPLTTGEYDQWGNPEEKIYYEYMKTYSPYDNVSAKDYPNILITTGLNDPRVAFWEPAKWTARLRALKTDDNLILLKTDLGAGHGGASGRYERIKETALIYSFILHTFGMMN
jgi:oligopeptidase B